jgi:tetratricopeptide (TPR) repeat protein
VVAGRYRVMGFVAEGAMGSVYAVEDQSLRERVALKTLRPSVASSPQMLKRFKRELRLARRVTHPHVCRVFDLGEHSGEAPEAGGASTFTFLTMEFLEGETLDTHLSRQGHMALEQVLLLAEQMAGALDAAHEAQVIHRDFKSGNVMLVPEAGGAGGLRAVVTDFGLARGEGLEDDVVSTQDGALVGTPGYMSPEQVEGRTLTPASDVYSFGVVLFEMVTGRRPFLGDTPMVVAVKRLFEPPPSPRALVPGLPPVWEEVLLRCLAREPRERFATASEAVEALRGGMGQAPAPGRKPARSGRFPAVQVPSVPEVGAGPLVPAEAKTSPGVQGARRAVAVLAPRNLSGQASAAWLSTALAEMLRAELSAGGQVRLLSGESVDRMRRELGLPEGESLAPDTLLRIQAHSGADLVLTGSYLLLGTEGASVVRLDLCLQDTVTGETAVRLTQTGAEKELLSLVLQLGASLRERLGISPLTGEQVRRVRGAMPASPQAARLYVEGLLALRSHEAPAAISWLERVVALEPAFAPAHSALAAAFKHLFQDSRARAAACRAFELSEGLPREERLLVMARHHEAQAEWAPAIEAYRTLFEFFPDNVEYGTALVSAQVSAGHLREALATIELLQRLPPPVGEDARIDLAAANATTFAGDFQASRRHAERAVARARRAGQDFIVASALFAQAFAMRTLGEPAHAVEPLEEAVRLSLAKGDRGGAARAIMARSIVLIDLGRLRDAVGSFATVVRVARELHNPVLEAEALGNSGWLSCNLGDLEGALKRSLRSKELFRKLEMRSEEASYDVQTGMVLRRKGNLDEAQRLLEQSRQALHIVFGDEYSAAWASYELGLVYLDRGELAQARAWLERALELRSARGLRPFIAETELALARVALASERPEEALTRVERASAGYAEQRLRAMEGLAQAVRAQALLAGGEAGLAREALARARTLAEGSEHVLVTTEVALAGARLVLREGTAPEQAAAARGLEALVAQAKRGRMMGMELEARLARAELEQVAGVAGAGACLRELEAEAGRLGYLGLARKAGVAARRET